MVTVDGKKTMAQQLTEQSAQQSNLQFEQIPLQQPEFKSPIKYSTRKLTLHDLDPLTLRVFNYLRVTKFPKVKTEDFFDAMVRDLCDTLKVDYEALKKWLTENPTEYNLITWDRISGTLKACTTSGKCQEIRVGSRLEQTHKKRKRRR